MVQFLSATLNCLRIQSGDPRYFGITTPTHSLRQQTRDPPPLWLVQPGKHYVYLLVPTLCILHHISSISIL